MKISATITAPKIKSPSAPEKNLRKPFNSLFSTF